MNEDKARKLEVPTEWNGKANVCTYCGRVPETFYVATGHDHTDDSIHWCICRDGTQYKSEIETLRQRVTELEKIIQRQQFIEDRYEELMLSARRCWRYYGADTELFNASIKTMDFLIRRHATEIDEMNEEQE